MPMGRDGLPVEFMGAAQFRGDACGSTSSRSMMSLMREVIRMALAPRLRSAVTVMQRMPLRCTILLWLQTAPRSAIWRRGTLTEGTGDEM